jgi:hypothetical protein
MKMLKKSITFNDLDGNPVTEDFYFNLSKAELAEFEMSEAGGMKVRLESIIENAEKDPGSVIREFKNIILMSYGVRSDDNKRFIKSEEMSNAFMQTDAYSELFTQLVTDPAQAISFINGIVPFDVSDQPSGNAADLPTVKPVEDVQLPADVAGSIQAAKDAGVPVTDLRAVEPTQKALEDMTREELLAYMEQRNNEV